MSDSHWTDKPNPEFEQWWATKTAEGYQYGREALENVRLGFEGAQEMRWQLIETAPKDGSWILLWWPYWNFRVLLGRFYRGQWEAETAISDAADSEPPTHWMPLPDPPSFEQGESS